MLLFKPVQRIEQDSVIDMMASTPTRQSSLTKQPGNIYSTISKQTERTAEKPIVLLNSQTIFSESGKVERSESKI